MVARTTPERATNDGSLYGLGVRTEIAPGTDQVGIVQAISAETGAVLWKHEQRAATSSLMATGGGLVFGGDHNGRFRGRQSWAVSTGRSLTSGAFNRLTPQREHAVRLCVAGVMDSIRAAASHHYAAVCRGCTLSAIRRPTAISARRSA